MKIILASNNKSKIREFSEILNPLGIEIISQKEAGFDIEVEETGTSFAENAALKAQAIFDKCHIPVIADDSGICVDALGGAPGIFSARCLNGKPAWQWLLEKTEGVPDDNRGVSYVCVICYINSEGKKCFFEGKCFGKVGYEKRGTNGFAYDYVFMIGDKSYAELTPDEKNAISHRGIAARLLFSKIEKE